MDEALSILRVASCAIGSDDGIDPLYLREAINEVDMKLQPVRELLNRTERYIDQNGVTLLAEDIS